MIKKLVFLSGILFLSLTLSASTDPCFKTLSGWIQDSISKTPVPHASITIKELNIGTYSDEKGHFHLDSLCPGSYTLIFRIIGYKSVAKPFNLKRSFTLVILLEEEKYLLKEVQIEANKSTQDIIQSHASISGQKLENTRGLSLGESLNNITGLNTIKSGPSISKPVIHGMHSNRVLILNNGVRQEGQQWGSEHAPEIDPFVASELTVVKGAASVRYGSDAIGGVVMVKPKPLKREHGAEGAINIVGLSNNRQSVFSGILNGNLRSIEGLAFRLQGTYKRAGNSFAPSYNLGNTGFREINFSSAVGYTGERLNVELFYSRFDTELGILKRSHIGNVDDLQSIITNATKDTSDFTFSIGRPKQNVRHNLAKLSAKYLTPVGDFNFTYAWQYNYRSEFDAHRPYNDQLQSKPDLIFKLFTNIGEVVWEHRPFGILTGSIGANGIMQANLFEGRKLIPNFTSYNGGLFWIEKVKVKKLELEAGFRYDYKWLQSFQKIRDSLSSEIRTWSNISGTLGASYKISQKLRWQTTIASAWRPPGINELFIDGVHHGAASYEKGDINLNAEKAYNFSTSVGYQGEKLQGQVDLYYNIIDNYIYLKPEASYVVTIRGAFPSFQYTQIDAAFRGIDADVSYKFTEAFAWTSKVALVRAFNRTGSGFIEYIPPDRYTNTLNINFPDFKKISNVVFSVSNITVPRQNRAPAETDFIPPPPTYTLFNTELNFDLSILNQLASIGLSVNNLFNSSYRDYLNRFRYFTEEPGRNFILRMKIPFTISK